MTYEVQQTRWDRIIRRVSGSIGPGSRVSETISEIFPMINLEDVPAELLLLGGTQICMGQTGTAGVAAEFAQSMIRNPGASGNIITVTQVIVRADAATAGTAGMTENTFATAGTQQIRDARAGVLGVPVGQCLSDSLGAVSPTFFRYFMNGTEDAILRDDNGLAVLPPGTAFSVGNLTANIGLSVGWMWRERPAEESELSL